MTRVHTIETRIHGRYLSAMPDGPGPHPWLLGCHGYGEAAPQQMAVLERLDPERRWGRVSVQGLHRFYTRSEDVVASWMTREDRDLAITDNVAYVRAVVDEVRRTLPVGDPLVLVGFSQGAAMAYRAAAAGLGARGLVVLAGDVPPDVAPRASALPPTLVGRGVRDAWYDEAKRDADLGVLREAGVAVALVEFDAGHVWDEAMVAEARAFLARIRDDGS